MNKKILYISDFFYEETNGGGEANDKELLILLENKYEIIKYKSINITLEFLKSFKGSIIVSNFALLKQEAINHITNNFNYVIYEHDHKYLINRNPAVYQDYKAPEEHIINKLFYTNAKAVFCQSILHKQIMDKNLKLNNSISLSGNLWSENALNLIENFSHIKKSNSYAIMNSNTEHKNTVSSIRYCNMNNISYQLINPCAHEKFLELLSNHKGLVFFPKTPETLSRISVEARMLNMSVITNKNLGASYEDWFRTKGSELVQLMRNKRIEIPELIERYL